MDNICRSCLSEERHMKSVFDTDSSLGETLQLFEMLMACTSVQVQEGDGLPAQICRSCINDIVRSITFKRRCEGSDATLREALRKSTITDDVELKPSRNVAAMCSQETVVAAIDPDIVDIKIEFEEIETSIDDSISNTEYSDCEKDEKKMVENVVDTLEFTNNFDVKPDEIKSELIHDEIDLEDEKSICPMSDDTEELIYACEECTACFTDENDLKIHSDTHRQLTGANNKCQVCGQGFVSVREFDRHMKELHDDAKKHVCNECGKGFKRGDMLKKHYWVHSGVKPYGCELCEKRFTRAFTLEEHMRAHANEKTFSCAECGMSFVRRTALNVHRKLHPGTQTRTCSICQKRCANPAVLAMHMRTHKVTNVYACSYCGKGFSMISNMKAHERIHTGEKPYVCNVCNKGFPSSSQLTLHLRRHSGEKPYVCDVCGKGYISASCLKRHKFSHTGEKPFPCHLCPKAYMSKQDCRIHITRHTLENL